MKTRMLSFCLSLVLLTFISAKAQQTYAIRGTVLDAQGAPVEAGNVLVLNFTDSSLIRGDLFLDGAFELQGIEAPHFWLKITALGYEDELLDINMDGREFLDVGEVTLVANATLDEVVVTSVVSGIQGSVESGKVVFKINEQGGNLSASASEVVGKLPGVFQDHNGQLSVFGRGAAVVLVNGRKPAPGTLENLRVEDIASVELITNPDARYQSEGKGGVINIITKREVSDGIYYQFRTFLTKAAFQRLYLGGNVSYRKGKWTWTGSMGYNPQKILFQDFYLRSYEDASGTVFSFDNTLEKERTFLKAFTYKAGVEYAWQRGSSIGFHYSGYQFGDNEFTTNVNELTSSSNEALTLDTKTNSDYHYGAHSFDLDYRHDFDSSATRSISFFSSVTYFGMNRLDDILFSSTSNGSTNTQKLENRSEERIALYYGQLDYTFPLWKQGGILTLGGRYDLATKESSLAFVQAEEPSSGDEDAYSYDEQIAATYLQWSKKQGSWDFGLGVRGEYSALRGTAKVTDFSVDTSALLFFPSASLSYALPYDLKVNVSYSKRITRPTFQELNPFTVYIDSFSFFRGNPALLPEIAHSYEMSLVYREFASIKWGYIQAIDPMFLTVRQDGLITTAITDNLERSDKYYISLTLPYETKRWTTYNVFGWTKDRYTYLVSSTEKIELQKPMWYAYLYNEVRLPGDFSTSLMFQYVSAGVNGIFDFREKWTMRWTLQKKIADGRWLLGLIVNDPFRTDLLRSHTALGNLDVYYDAYTDRRYVRLFVKYAFGKPFDSAPGKKSQNVNRIKAK